MNHNVQHVPQRAEFLCPYCAHANHLCIPQFGTLGMELVCCDSETGGCDSYFAVSVRVTTTLIPTVRRIERCSKFKEYSPDPQAAAFLAAAEVILKRFDQVADQMPALIDRDGERFAGGYLEGIGQAAGLLRHLVDAAKEGGGV